MFCCIAGGSGQCPVWRIDLCLRTEGFDGELQFFDDGDFLGAFLFAGAALGAGGGVAVAESVIVCLLSICGEAQAALEVDGAAHEGGDVDILGAGLAVSAVGAET